MLMKRTNAGYQSRWMSPFINAFCRRERREFHFGRYDYVKVDAVDTVTARKSLVMKAQESGNSVISSMGAGNKLDPSRFQVADIYKTKVCPLAKVMRQELKKKRCPEAESRLFR